MIWTVLIWGGAAVSVLGLVGILWSVVTVTRARRAGLDDTALRAQMGRSLVINLGSLMVSVIGLMMVVIGIFLGP
ncbi:hypothetical protein ACEYYB_09090 [Paracoccus sp. p4-l81]|uniref:hypothetical protein n=1 Tax=Paracoccus sp. p4-l81 TaxID=3342806 RepID=UPI0035B7E5E0